MRVHFSDEKEFATKNEDDEKEENKEDSSSSGGGSPMSAGKGNFDDLSPTFSMFAYPCFPTS